MKKIVVFFTILTSFSLTAMDHQLAQSGSGIRIPVIPPALLAKLKQKNGVRPTSASSQTQPVPPPVNFKRGRPRTRTFHSSTSAQTTQQQLVAIPNPPRPAQARGNHLSQHDRQAQAACNILGISLQPTAAATNPPQRLPSPQSHQGSVNPGQPVNKAPTATKTSNADTLCQELTALTIYCGTCAAAYLYLANN